MKTQRQPDDKGPQKKKPALQRQGAQYFAPSPGYSGEMKYFDSELAINAVTSSASWTSTMRDPSASPVANINCLFAPTQGVNINQRVGKSAYVHKIKIKGILVAPAQTNQIVADAASLVRVLLVQDMQTNGAQMTGAQLMTASSLSDNRVAIQQFQNVNNFGRFKVLKEKFVSFNSQALSYDGTNMEQGGLAYPFKMTYNFRKPVQVRFNATNGGTIADIVDNSFHIVANASTTDMTVNICYASRISFKE